jgi:hypothetical protein
MFKVQGSSFHLLFILLFVFYISACDFTSNKKPRSTGRTNEILVVTNSKQQWEGALGDSIRGFFMQYQVGLPQPEPMFELYNIPESAINKTFKALHAIFIVDINKDFKEPLLEAKKDLWSKPQLVIKITAPDVNMFYEVFRERKEGFLEAYIDLEIRRTNNFFKMAEDHTLGARINKKFGFSLDIPGGFAVAYEDDDFMWLRQTMHKVKQDAELGIMIYKMPYTDTTAFAAQSILDLRDTVTFKYVPGPSEGSYMATSRDVIAPVSIRKSDYVTDFAVETRGLWMVVNDFMGGPFINYTFTDPENQYLIMLDGYVYNPNGLKRNFVRQLEAIFHTLQFSESR